MSKKHKIFIYTLLIMVMLMVIWAAIPMIDYFLSGDNTIEHKVKSGNEVILRLNVLKIILIGF